MNELIAYLMKYKGDYEAAADAPGSPYRFSSLKEAAQFITEDGSFNEAKYKVSERFGSYGKAIEAYKSARYANAEVVTQRRISAVDLDRFGSEDKTEWNTYIEAGGEVLAGISIGKWEEFSRKKIDSSYWKNLPNPTEEEICNYFKL